MDEYRGGGLSLECVMTTPEGLVPLNWLRPGDMIQTRDAGFQPIRRIKAGDGQPMLTLGGGVADDQRILVGGWPVQINFGHDLMLAHAGDLADTQLSVPQKESVRIMMDQPSFLRVGDIWAESHGQTRPIYPVLTRAEVNLVRHQYASPIVPAEEISIKVEPEVSTTFGSHAAVA